MPHWPPGVRSRPVSAVNMVLQIHFLLPDGQTRSVTATPGQTVMEVAVAAGIDGIEGMCGGCVSCATCHVYVHPQWRQMTMPAEGELLEGEIDMLDTAFATTDWSRLSCQIILTNAMDGLILALPGRKIENEQSWL